MNKQGDNPRRFTINLSMEDAPKYTSKPGDNQGQHNVNKDKGLDSSYWQSTKPDCTNEEHGQVVVIVAATGPQKPKKKKASRIGQPTGQQLHGAACERNTNDKPSNIKCIQSP